MQCSCVCNLLATVDPAKLERLFAQRRAVASQKRLSTFKQQTQSPSVVNSACSTYLVTLGLTQTVLSPTKPWRLLCSHKTYTLRTTNRTEKASTGVQNQPFEPRTTQQTLRREQPCWLNTPNKTTRSKSRSSRTLVCCCLLYDDSSSNG